MCVSATMSFGMAGLLTGSGVYALHKARAAGARYVPLALFSLFVGAQQALEGLVWTGAESGQADLVRMAALGYLFFAWIVWPSWVPYMTARLEEKPQKRKLFLHMAGAGFMLGLVLYLPNFWEPDWLRTETAGHSIAYRCTLISDGILPRGVPYVLYLAAIGLPPLLSSQRALNIFGAGLWLFVPLTYFFFRYEHVSVLCFFAAVMTLYIIYIILENKCQTRPVTRSA